MSTPSPQARTLLERTRKTLRGGPALLETIGWPRSLERAFFASGCEIDPEPRYQVDRAALRERLDALEGLDREARGDDALTRLVQSRVKSHRLAAELLLAVGTPRFGELSVEIYGGARTSWLDGDTTNLDFADHLAARLGPPESVVAADEEASTGSLEAGDMVAYVQGRLERLPDAPRVEVLVDEDLAAKAIAGKARLRVRADARFSREEARALYLHEVETHVMTAQNGDAQPHLDFLDSGGPNTTRTQEGLAVFAELHAQALTTERIRRLVARVHLVAMAEDGATFVDLYRALVERGAEPRAAYLDVMRIFRGGVPSGGSAFTKDASYLAGLVEVYDFLRIAVAHHSRDVAEVLVSGRLALDEMEALVELRREGVLAAPRFVPSWLRRWDDLLAHFAFTSFLGEIDLAHVAKRYAWLGRG